MGLCDTLEHAGAAAITDHLVTFLVVRLTQTAFRRFFLPSLADRGIVVVVVDGSCGVNNDNKPYAENIYQYATKMGRSTVT